MNQSRFQPPEILAQVGIAHFLTQSVISLEKNHFFLELAREPIGESFSSKNRTQGENSVSKIGVSLIDLKNFPLNSFWPVF